MTPQYTYTTYSRMTNEIGHGQTEAHDMNDVVEIVGDEYTDVYNVKMVADPEVCKVPYKGSEVTVLSAHGLAELAKRGGYTAHENETFRDIADAAREARFGKGL